MMSDADRSSGAAQGAQDDDADSQQSNGGFWRFLTFGLGDEESESMNGAAHAAAGRHGLASLTDIEIADVAVPKGEIVAVEAETGLDDVVQNFRDSGFTRLPVFEGTLDMPIGLVHLKDVALRYGFNGSTDEFSLRELARPLIYAPPSMPIGVLLQKMQSQRMHMALVIDEYGGTDGLVTIEDLIEQIVGEIEDEHDVDEARPWTEESAGCYLALARAPLEEFASEIGIDLGVPDTDDEADTLGGIVFLLTGRVPARGEVIKHPAGVEIEVVDAAPRRIKRLRIRVPDKAADEP